MSRNLEEHESINLHISKGTAIGLIAAIPLAWIMWNIPSALFKGYPGLGSDMSVFGWTMALGMVVCWVLPVIMFFIIRSKVND